MRGRWKLALALLILLLGVSRGWEALGDWQARDPWIFGAVSSLVYLTGAGLIWRDRRSRG
ncbi:hypothetical protein [Deinococcus budaensis]|uniref:Putative membrane protein YdfJ with MMPL/SSD domain n=1 Tax=Deinococcus budaensis TaxID=1665626 RepID=A0A7W8LP30_9DEIO|nr:hypothetical protein [Deinococcus budaensis]MBB5233358.1 putative membrane protein YdfJ with MMPL/SSD domain [Deinococcus budaensis]